MSATRFDRRRLALAMLSGAGVALAGALAACVIADPPPELPTPLKHHPNIVHGATRPPDDRVITRWPDEFIVPVEVVDPASCFDWRAFVDFDPIANNVAAFQPDQPECQPQLDGGIAFVEVPLPAPADTSQCHVIEFIVALGFLGNSPHTPNASGADSVHWFYNPSGDVGACATYDAGGIDGAFPSDVTDVIIVPPSDGGGQ